MNGIVLASGSVTRRSMLESAGLSFTTAVPNVDEETMREILLIHETGPQEIALALAEAKALAVAQRLPDGLVIGADQVLVCGGRLFGKALDEGGARATLLALRGQTHRLISAVALAQDGDVLWRRAEQAVMRMRDFSDEFLHDYLTQEMPEILGSVGCYRIEGRGALLFDDIAGDHFTVRGMPLIPLLVELRARGAIPS